MRLSMKKILYFSVVWLFLSNLQAMEQGNGSPCNVPNEMLLKYEKFLRERIVNDCNTLIDEMYTAKNINRDFNLENNSSWKSLCTLSNVLLQDQPQSCKDMLIGLLFNVYEKLETVLRNNGFIASANEVHSVGIVYRNQSDQQPKKRAEEIIQNRDELIKWISSKRKDALQTPMWVSFHGNAERFLKTIPAHVRDINIVSLCNSYYAIARNLTSNGFKNESREVCSAWMALCDVLYGNQSLPNGNCSLASKLWNDTVEKKLTVKKQEVEKALSEKQTLVEAERIVKHVLNSDWIPNNLMQTKCHLDWFKLTDVYIRYAKKLTSVENTANFVRYIRQIDLNYMKLRSCKEDVNVQSRPECDICRNNVEECLLLIKDQQQKKLFYNYMTRTMPLLELPALATQDVQPSNNQLKRKAEKDPKEIVEKKRRKLDDKKDSWCSLS